jgi:hypothetical protein
MWLILVSQRMFTTFSWGTLVENWDRDIISLADNVNKGD